MFATKTDSGKELNKEWGIGASHCLYHYEGDWYHLLESFPAALCDAHGYLRFDTKDDLSSFIEKGYINIGEHLHVPGGISKLPGYKKMR